MGAEEKKLLPSTDADVSHEHRSGLKLHCFPDIPLSDPENIRTCLALEEDFKRTRFGDRNTACSDWSPEYGSPATKPEKDAASAGRFDVEAYQKGFNDGLAKGCADGEQAGFERASNKLEPLLDGLQEALGQLKNLRAETYHSIEKEVMELALAIARKVICREIAMDREIVAYVAREALASVENPGDIKIKMNPQDLQYINETKYKLSELIGNIDIASLEPEENIQSGGCIIESNLGEIDARIEKQLLAVEESFRNAFENSGPQG